MVKINDVVYKVSTGYSTTYTIDRSLDFGSFVIPLIERSEPFDMFSEIEITRDDGTVEYYLLSGDIIEISSYQPVRYSHNIQFVEYTKKLEHYVISSATFTQPTDGTTRYNIDDVLQRLVDISVFETSSRHPGARPCVLDSSVAAKLGNIKAPEFFFNNITLREALDEVLGAIPGIARLAKVNGVDTLFVDYFDQTKAIADLSEGVGYVSQRSIDNYATTLVGDVSNALRSTQGTESVSTYPNTSGWASVTSPLGVGVLDNDRVVFDFKANIYDLVKLEIFANIRIRFRDANNVQQQVVETFERDITKYVFTKNQFDNGLGANWNYTTDITQQNAIYYETGNRYVEGLGTNWTSGAFTQNVNKRRAIEHIIATEIVNDGTYPNGVVFVEIGTGTAASFENDLTQLLFRATFIPVETSNRVEVEKDEITDFTKETKTYFKQTATLINLNNYMNRMRSELQRIGEERFSIMLFHKSFADVLELGDFLDDGHILMTRTITQEKDFVMANYEFSRNYQQINDFIGINKAKNEFELIGEDKVIDRFVVYKDYVVLSEVGDTLPLLTNDTRHLFTIDGINAYMNTFTQIGTPKTIEATVFRPDPAITILNGVNGSGVGASLVLTTSFNHQNFAGFSIIPGNQDDGGLRQLPISYAFQGLLPSFEFEFITKFTGPQLSFELERNRSRTLPLLSRTDYEKIIETNDTGSMILFKDPGERLNFTYQLQAVAHPNSADVFVVGNYFHDYNALVHNTFETLRVYGNTERYNRSDKEIILENSVDLGALDCSLITSFPNSPVLNILNSVIGYNSYAVADENGRLLFAVNKKSTGLLPTAITFNFNHRRPNLNKL